MRIFIFENVEQMTANYHSRGGLVVIAENAPDVKALIKDYPHITLTEDDWNNSKSYALKHAPEKELFIFPDAGCC